MYIILWKAETRGSGQAEVPDHSHGDVHPGPYPTRKAAFAALREYIDREISVDCQRGYIDYFDVYKLEGPCRRLTSD